MLGERRNDMSSGIVVKVGRMGTHMEEIPLSKGRETVADALRKAELKLKPSEMITVNGDEEEDDFELSDGDRIRLVKNVAGGA